MKTINKIPTLLLLASLVFSTSNTANAATIVNLGTASNFAVLAGSAINDTNPSVIVGGVGLSPTTGTAIGLTAGEVTGSIYAVNAFGPLGSIENPGLLTTAKNDLTSAYLGAEGQTGATIPTELGGGTITAGVYDTASGELAITGTLTLDGQGDTDAIFIFQAGSTLITASNSTVKLVNGAQACNVFWQVTSSATLGTNSNFKGNILALASITDNGGSTIQGRLLARTGAVTLNDTAVTKADCVVPTPETVPGATSSRAGDSNRTVTAATTTVAETPTPEILMPQIIQVATVYNPGVPNTGGNTSSSLLLLQISLLLLGTGLYAQRKMLLTKS